ncbi:MAG: arsenate reductase [Neisseria sp.]|nr:arsenate reductase [Neisseria sp.]
MIKIYGIPNCDTVKKARRWLAEQGVDYEFVDFKKTPPGGALIESWLQDIPLDVLLNKRGTTWRKLDDEQKSAAESRSGAVALMAEQPSLIKRPVLDANGRFYAGFQTASYESVFGK